MLRILVRGPAGFLGHYQQYEPLGKLLDDLSDKFGVSLCDLQLNSCSGEPLLDGLNLKRLREHLLYENTSWNHKNRKREAANHVHVPAGEQLADDMLARILDCSLDLPIAETLGSLPVVYARAPFCAQVPMRGASARRAGHRGSRNFTITVTRSCTWRHLKEKLAMELHEIHCNAHEIVFTEWASLFR